MLNSVLIVGVPMVALLAAAFYVFKRSQTTAQGPEGSRQSSVFAWPGSQAATTTVRRRARNRQSDEQDGSQSSASDSPDSGFVEEDHCEICFENTRKVQLYPCKHNDICEVCVNKILTTDRRECPFCRRTIVGYVDLQSGDRFG